MNVLIGCEFSGIVREAFRERGHTAWSCDLLDTEIPGQHIKGNVLDYLEGVWVCPNCRNYATISKRKSHVYCCCRLSNNYTEPFVMCSDIDQGDVFEWCGGNGRKIKKYRMDFTKWDLAIFHPPCTHMSNVANRWRNRPGHYEARLKDREFFEACWNAPIPRICVENPQGDPNIFMKEVYGVEYQTIHPYCFGGTERKRTNLWLKNLSPLQYDRNVQPPAAKYHISEGRKCAGKAVHFVESKGGNAKARSRTFSEIAAAMAEQWG